MDVYVLAIVASTGFWQFLMAVWQTRRKKNDSNAEALRVLLHDRLYQLCQHYIAQGEIDVDGLENLTHIYKVYHEGLGGNGTGTELYNRTVRLPLKKEGAEV